ncbi:hypothetical protein [Streptomyces sp. F-3]|jgi:hypothetical protein|uniref:hypothetical protein n=1 Tax=Streptomyces sp. F-3 TaxID=1840095 RepID=UPI000A4EBD22|nr:hypothetical protein [Streptomyces sp. F-3]
MPKPMRPALERTRAPILSLLSLLLPATGRRRRPRRPGHAPASPRTLSGLRLLIRHTAVPGLCAALPRPRTRTRPETSAPLQDTGPLVRPYLLAHERLQRQEERRAALVLALEGIDVGPWVIHGHRIGTPVGVAA